MTNKVQILIQLQTHLQSSSIKYHKDRKFHQLHTAWRYIYSKQQPFRSMVQICRWLSYMIQCGWATSLPIIQLQSVFNIQHLILANQVSTSIMIQWNTLSGTDAIKSTHYTMTRRRHLALHRSLQYRSYRYEDHDNIHHYTSVKASYMKKHVWYIYDLILRINELRQPMSVLNLQSTSSSSLFFNMHQGWRTVSSSDHY